MKSRPTKNGLVFACRLFTRLVAVKAVTMLFCTTFFFFFGISYIEKIYNTYFTKTNNKTVAELFHSHCFSLLYSFILNEFHSLT